MIEAETCEYATELAKSHSLRDDEYEKAIVNGDHRITVIGRDDFSTHRFDS